MSGIYLTDPHHHQTVPAPAGALAFVQSITNSKTSGGGVTTITATLGNNPVWGNALVAFLSTVDNTGIAPATPDGWTLVNSDTAGSGEPMGIAIFVKVAAQVEPKAITVAAAGGGWEVVSLHIEEWEGTDQSSPVDKNNLNDETGGTSLTASTGSTGTLSQADEACIAQCAFRDNDFDDANDSQWTAAFTHVDFASMTNWFGADLTTAWAWDVVSATTAVTATLTVTGGNAEERLSGIVTLKKSS